MRKSLSFLVLLSLTTACGSGGEPETKRTSEQLQTFDVSEAPPPPPPPSPMSAPAEASADTTRFAGPQIGVSAAPGVAFNYRYAFRLPGERVASVQEQHAQACEKLGLDRCRITGMRYRLVNERDIEGMIAFKLAPDIAREFGKRGIAAVTQADGMLIDSEISGEDVGSQIEASTRNDAQLGEDLERIERQLARPGLRSTERAELQAQAQRLRETLRANSAGREEKRESLAKTPVVFHYGSGELVPGFDNQSPLHNAVERAGENFMEGIAFMVVIAVSLLPWALLLLLAFWLWRRMGKPLPRATSNRNGEAGQAEDAAPPL